jgi:hypothetical protein
MFDCFKSKAKRSQLGYGSGPIIPTPQPAPVMGWAIGPVINGQNYSKEMPASTPDGNFVFPLSPGSVNYVTKGYSPGPSLSIDYEVIGGPVKPEEVPEGAATIALYMECSDNDWQSDGGRWWTRTRGKLTPGRHALSVPVASDKWVTVQNAHTPEMFAAAMPKVVRAGFTFGGPDGAGHGVFAVNPDTRFVLHSFA